MPRIRKQGGPLTPPITIKYNVDQDEIKNFSVFDSEVRERSNSLDRSTSAEDGAGRSRKSDLGGFIINKYLKAFKAEKANEERQKGGDDDGADRRNQDVPNESSGSPIKEYFNKLSKRSESLDTATDLESTKEVKDKDLQSERWKLFSDFKSKFSQAVEDIKSSKSTEGTDASKEKLLGVDISLTDSEDNSLQQEVDTNSYTSTENQVSSLTSSVQNLSELSPPIISHSSTMTDMEIESSSSIETNKSPIDKTKPLVDSDPAKTPRQDTDDDFIEENNFEVESGVDALEDAELSPPSELNIDSDVSAEQKTSKSQILSKYFEDGEPKLLTVPLGLFTSFILTLYVVIPSFVMLNGVFVGIYISYLTNKLYSYCCDILKSKKTPKSNQMDYSTKISLSRIPHIVEFEPIKKYEGWINTYMFAKYDPSTYHISLTQTAFMKLEGITLRLSFTNQKIPKHALWNEPTHDVPFHQHRIYNLAEARIQLLPMGIVKKRHWSKKYPICIILKDKSKLTVYNAKSGSNDESLVTNTLSVGKNDQCDEKEVQSSDFDTNVKSSPKRKLDFFGEKNDKIDTIATDTDNPSDTSSCADKSKKPNEKEITGTETYCDIETNCENFALDINESESTPERDFPSKDWCKDELTDAGQDQIFIYLFGRTGKEKEEWFRRIKSAIDNNSVQNLSPYEDTPDSNDLDDLLDSYDDNRQSNSESKCRLGSVKTEKKTGKNEMPSVLWTPSNSTTKSRLANSFYPKQDDNFWKYMKDVIETRIPDSNDEGQVNNLMWVNAILGRMIFDIFKNSSWITMVQKRIQKKLTTLKLPTFMGPLVVTALEFGPESPQLYDVSAPDLNDQGLWIDLQLSYNGRVTMTLTTQLNLMKLKERKESIKTPILVPEIVEPEKVKKNHAVYNSDSDDSAESSSEDEAILVQSLPPKMPIDPDVLPVPATSGNSSAKKILRMVDRIAASKYFQHVTEYKYVRRAMEGVSNTDLKLSVELCSLNGCLTVNIPPPPSDRIWLGFRGNPQLCLRAKPIVGSHTINIAHITTWIENKLCTEFEKLLVLPNMEDFQFDCMIPPVID